jgi:hypothetical protein
LKAYTSLRGIIFNYNNFWWDKALRLVVNILQQKWMFFYKYANLFIADINYKYLIGQFITINSFCGQILSGINNNSQASRAGLSNSCCQLKDGNDINDNYTQ